MTSKVLCGVNQLRHLISRQRKVCRSIKRLCVCGRERLISWYLTSVSALTGSATLWSIDGRNPTSVFEPPSPAAILILRTSLLSPARAPHSGTPVVFRVLPPSSSCWRGAGFCSPPGHPLQTFTRLCRGNACAS